MNDYPPVPASYKAPKPLVSHRVRLWLLILGMLILFGALVLFGISNKKGHQAEVLKASNNKDTLVTAVQPSRSKPSSTLTLPGELSPYLQTSIYSRTNGTLRQRFVDIGDHVRKGQLLAIVDVPELDQELMQAQANVAQAESTANEQKTRMDLAKISFERWEKNAESGGVSQQEVDQRKADFATSQAAYKVAQAGIAQSRANVRRLRALEGYKRIVAPFSGFITARNIDAGANIVSGGSSTSTNLFTIAQMDRLRIFINVPQANVDGIKVGLPAQVRLPEQPKSTYAAQVTRMSNSLDPASRTMRTEVGLPNPAYRLTPGRYAQVSLNIPRPQPAVLVPNTVLIVNADGTHVMVIQSDSTLRYQAVVPGRDDGEMVEILSGLSANERIVGNPNDALKNGQKVKILDDQDEPKEK